MFGYVTVYKPELKIKDYEAYKGVYCTLCKNMGKKFGIISRLLLSYDSTFYALFRIALNDRDLSLCKAHCTFNPTKKCLKINNEKEIFDEASALTIILSYFKLEDNIKDSKGIKELLYKLLKPYFLIKVKKARKEFNGIYGIACKAMEKQEKAEKENSLMDIAAHPTAQMLKLLLALHYEDESIQRFAYMLGRVIYFMDAYDDYDKDIKEGTFNPFKETDDLVNEATIAINTSVGEMAELLTKIDIYKYRPVIENVIIYGFSNRLKEISRKYEGEISEPI